jgi:hypothetical protein
MVMMMMITHAYACTCHLHDSASGWIIFRKVIAAALVAASIPTATVTIIHWPPVALITWGWPTMTMKARAPINTIVTLPTTHTSREIWWWVSHGDAGWLRWRIRLWRRCRRLLYRLRLLSWRRIWSRFRRLLYRLGLLRWRRRLRSRFRRLLYRLGLLRWRRLGLLRWRRLGLRGRWRRYDLNALNGVTALAAYLFLNLFRGAAHHFDYHRVLLLVVYLVSYFSCSQNSTPPHIYIESTQSFSFSPRCFISNHVKYITTTERVQRERETHEGICIEFSSPSCSSDGTEDQPSAPLSLSPVKKEQIHIKPKSDQPKF